MYFDVVLCPYQGWVEKITAYNKQRIFEYESLFVIKTDVGTTEVIHTSISGEIESLEVEEGDEVIPGMVLAYLKGDII